MDVLDRLLDRLDIEVEPFAVCDVRAGWHLAVAAAEVGHVTVHYALRGSGRIAFADGRRSRIGPHTVVLCPPRLGHRIEVTEGERVLPGACASPHDGLAWLRAGDAGAQVLVACGRRSRSRSPTVRCRGPASRRCSASSPPSSPAAGR
jgi:AraC family transcriptional regulator, activator of mtrCDE